MTNFDSLPTSDADEVRLRGPGVLGVVYVTIAGATVWLTGLAYLAIGLSRQLGLPEIRNTQEVIGYGFVAVVTFGIAACQAYGRHAEIDFITPHLPPAGRRAHAFVSHLFGAVVGGILTLGAFQFAAQSFALGIVSTSTLAVPLFIPQGLLVVGGLALTVEFIRDAVDVLRRRVPPRPETA